MKYSMGDSLADYGFKFYEKLHEPIFLINRIGKIIKINEAGRKLMKIARLTSKELEILLTDHLNKLSELATVKTTLISSHHRRVHVKTCKLANSDYILIEVRR